MSETESKYEQFGVSASKSGLHAALGRMAIAEERGYFIKLNADLAGDANYSSFVHCDGAGTKCIVAYLLYKATGDRKYFRGLAQDSLVMNLDDVLCAGLPDTMLLANLVARNAHLIDYECVAEIIDGYRTLIGKLAEYGVDVQLAGGETADCGDTVRTLMVDSVLAGRIKNANLVNCTRIQAGDVIVGLASTGQAKYEDAPNSGISSNGLTMARRILLHRDYAKENPECAATEGKESYLGKFRVQDLHPSLKTSVGEALLSPTRTFAPILIELFRKNLRDIHGAIHATGGALTKVLRFGEAIHVIKDNLFPMPPIFSLIQSEGNVSQKEMYEVFNCGQRIELYIPESFVPTIQSLASSFGVESRVIGRVETSKNGPANHVTIKDASGVYEYRLK